MNNDALEQYISDLRTRAGNLLVPYASKEQRGRSSGYQHCADELQSMIDAEKEQQP